MKQQERAVIASYIRENVSKSYHTISRDLGWSYGCICRIAQEFEIHREGGPKQPRVGQEQK